MQLQPCRRPGAAGVGHGVATRACGGGVRGAGRLAGLPPAHFFFNDPATTETYTLSLHDALPICYERALQRQRPSQARLLWPAQGSCVEAARSEEHTSELQSHSDLVCRLLLE